MRLKELALARVRFGYLRLTVLLRREGWTAGKKLVCRLYREMDLSMRTKKRRRLASRSRILLPAAEAPNERWSMDFVTSRLENGRCFRVLTLVDQYTRECLALEPAFSMTGVKVAACLDAVAVDRGLPKSIRVDNGTEFQSRAMDAWAYHNGVQLDFIRPGKPVENCLGARTRLAPPPCVEAAGGYLQQVASLRHAMLGRQFRDQGILAGDGYESMPKAFLGFPSGARPDPAPCGDAGSHRPFPAATPPGGAFVLGLQLAQVQVSPLPQRRRADPQLARQRLERSPAGDQQIHAVPIEFLVVSSR